MVMCSFDGTKNYLGTHCSTGLPILSRGIVMLNWKAKEERVDNLGSTLAHANVCNLVG
jgi:hypothetical protein